MFTPVSNGATLQCTCGLGETRLVVGGLPVFHGRSLFPIASVATLLDCIPLVNIPPFQGCSASLNPQPPVGLLKACVPVFPAPWQSLVPGILIPPSVALDSGALLFCAYGGIVRVLDPGEMTTNHTQPTIDLQALARGITGGGGGSGGTGGTP